MYPVLELVQKGGPVMIPIVLLSVLTLATALERTWFWVRLISQEDRCVHRVLEAARYDLGDACQLAEKSEHLAIGRFLAAPLKLGRPSVETFRLMLESTADKEFVKMRKGDKLLETIVALSPLLGLLGTVTGLIATFENLNIGSGGSAEETSAAARGIGEALITTAAGMVVAILSLVIYRVLVTLQARQMDYFSEVGTELELVYRQFWHEANPDESNGKGEEEPSHGYSDTDVAEMPVPFSP
ncbi:MAG: MotA/TolQ/ExbB proton channel family protein [Merismopedia sp. SIO2A8]|nr:MotA/TolQ/ExbB proton channel family protein [Symploca sp. SIO2B6]NET52648.1 MotA/TolQ/ExbB proton channel family protein [Merismopedia sp. SIO2A8]